MDGTDPTPSLSDNTATAQGLTSEYLHGEQIHTWCGDGFRIEIRAQHTTFEDRSVRLSYRVFDDLWAGLTGQGPLVFAGDDLLSAPHTATGDQAARALSAIFGCEAGDVADTFFAPYSPAQLGWRDARAGDLATWGSRLGPDR